MILLGRFNMTKFDEQKIRETAYYIWKDSGCPANSSANDWNAAIDRLNAIDALSTANRIASSCRTASMISLSKKMAASSAHKETAYRLVKTTSRKVTKK